MTPREALAEAVRECGRFRYRAEPPGADYWQTPAETDAAGVGDCEDLSVWTLTRAYALAGSGDFRLVAGEADGGGHAWIELHDEEGVWWADPTPGWSKAIDPPRLWNRTPQFAYRWDGKQFTVKSAWAPVTVDG